jgi:hypothetical protein
MRSIYQIQAHLKTNDKTDTQVLAYHIYQVATAIPEMIPDAVEQVMSARRGNDEALSPVLLASRRAWHVCILSFNRLCHSAGGTDTEGYVIHALVRCFAEVLKCIDVVANVESRNTGTDPLAPRVTAKTKKALSDKGTVLLSGVVKLLSAMLEELDPKADSHSALFEGVAFVILNKLGPTLFVLTFGHARGTMEAEIAAGAGSHTQAGNDEQFSECIDDAQLTSAQLLAPYLVHLLARLMSAAPFCLRTATSKTNKKPEQGDHLGGMKSVLSTAAKERLQKTLVKCMFTDSSQEDETSFKDCLRMPKPIATVDVPHQDVDRRQWFKQEVWRLLGWEILCTDNDTW